MPRPKLTIVTTAPISLDKLLKGQLRFLSRTYDVTAISAPGPELDHVGSREGVAVQAVPMVRRPAPFRDVRSLLHLLSVFRRSRPDIVHAYTPKAGLLAMVAAQVARVPIRVRTINGLPLMESSGLRRHLLMALERLGMWAATDVLVNSQGLGEFVQQSLAQTDVGMVSHGSTNGVDIRRFSRDAPGLPRPTEVRNRLGIPAEATVILFVGRIVRDKGVVELVDSFSYLAERHDDLYLVLVGGYEATNAVPDRVMRQIAESARIVETGFVEDVRPYMLAADLLVLPSYREGLPNVLLQAGSLGVAMIATDIPGCQDVLSHDRSGLLAPPKDSAALRQAIESLVDDPDRRSELAAHGQRDVREKFDQAVLWDALQSFYAELLAARV